MRITLINIKFNAKFVARTCKLKVFMQLISYNINTQIADMKKKFFHEHFYS